MKIQKVDGVYKKPGLRAHSRVPLWVWLPLFLIASAGILVIILQTMIVQNESVPQFQSVRKRSVKLVAVGDIACSREDINFNDGNGVVNACKQKDVGYAIERENADAVLFLGDLQYPTGDYVDYEKSFIPYMRDITAPIYSVAGNHDYGNGQREASLEGYKKALDLYFTRPLYMRDEKTYFEFNLASWQVSALDSNCEYVGGCGIDSEQYAWLDETLEQEKVCRIGAWHHPTKSSGVYKDSADSLRASELEKLLRKAGVDIVLNGHEHHYERLSDYGTQYFVVGTGGVGLRKAQEPQTTSEIIIDDSFGYLYLELFAGRYEWQFKNTIGDVLDEGSGSCGATLSPV